MTQPAPTEVLTDTNDTVRTIEYVSDGVAQWHIKCQGGFIEIGRSHYSSVSGTLTIEAKDLPQFVKHLYEAAGKDPSRKTLA